MSPLHISNPSPSDSSPDEESDSDSSSVVYDHEPFSTFRSRALAVAVGSIWPGSVPDEITAERLAGGGFNRIIGLSRDDTDVPSGNRNRAQYILRIPRFESAQINDEVAVIKFLHQFASIPAPKVISFDKTENNALGSPYALRHEERCRVARELGRIFNQMLTVQSSVTGKLILPPDGGGNPNSPIHVAPLGSKSANLGKPYKDTTPSESTHKYLTAISSARKADNLEQFSSDTVEPKIWDKIFQMTSELDAGGWLADRHYSIAHLDLAPRNILVDPTSDAQLPIVSGILGWDSAILAPAFMSCTPPMWIWAWLDDEVEDERMANDDPGTVEGRQLNILFEEAAGEDYVRFAYDPAYRLARRLARFAFEGVRSNEDFKESEVMLQHWAVVCESNKGNNTHQSKNHT